MPKAAPSANKPRLEAGVGQLQLSGDLTFATVTALLAESQALFATGGDALRIDLSAVGRADSAGLALLIEWLRVARRAGRTLEFHGVPDQMVAIAKASGLAEVLPLNPA